MQDFTSKFQGFTERFTKKFIATLDFMYKLMPHVINMIARKKAVGVDAKFESPGDTWKDSLKLANSVFGFAPPRPVGPMVEYVGPITPKQYEPSTVRS